MCLLLLLTSCIQAQENGVNTAEEAVRNSGSFDSVEVFDTYNISEGFKLVFLKGVNTNESIWVGSTKFNKDRNVWTDVEIVKLGKPTNDTPDVKTMFESGDGYSVGFVKGNAAALGEVDHMVEIEEDEDWKIWVKSSGGS